MILLTTLSKAVPWIAIAIWDSRTEIFRDQFRDYQECIEFAATWHESTAPFSTTPERGEPVLVGCIQGDIKTHRFMLDIMTQRGKEP